MTAIAYRIVGTSLPILLLSFALSPSLAAPRSHIPGPASGAVRAGVGASPAAHTQTPDTTLAQEQVARLQRMLDQSRNDWANLRRYNAANAQVGQPAPGENRVVFMGDSITDAWIAIDPAFFQGKPYLDRGISGQTTPQMLVRFRPDVIDLEPRAVLILAGTNDIAGNTGPETPEIIEGNIASMVELAQANGIRVVLCSILPAYDYPWKPGLQPAPKIAALNRWIKEYAARRHALYLDYYSAMVDARGGLKPELTTDGVHPNKAGYAIMEPLAERAIARALRR